VAYQQTATAWQAIRYWLRRNLRAALWVLAVGVLLGVAVLFFLLRRKS